MNKKYCQIVLIGHASHKLTLSVDKEITNKLIFVIEKKQLSGSKKAMETLEILKKYYETRMVEVETVKFNFHIQTKPVAELVHKIYQQKLLGFDIISVNISGGLRYMDIWFYIACSITNIDIIHGDFIYKGNEEKGIIHPGHNPKYDIDEDALPLGCAILALTALKYLSG